MLDAEKLFNDLFMQNSKTRFPRSCRSTTSIEMTRPYGGLWETSRTTLDSSATSRAVPRQL